MVGPTDTAIIPRRGTHGNPLVPEERFIGSKLHLATVERMIVYA